MYCEKCGNKLEADSVFCSRCGTKVINNSNMEYADHSENNGIDGIREDAFSFIMENNMDMSSLGFGIESGKDVYVESELDTELVGHLSMEDLQRIMDEL